MVSTSSNAAHLHAVAQMLAVRRHAHRLLTAGDHDVAVAVEDGLIAERDRAKAGAAELVHAPRGALHRDAGRNRGLAGRVLALTGGQDLAHDDLRDPAALDAGALERLLDRDLAQLMGRKAAKRPVEGANRRAGGADDDDVVLHREISCFLLRARSAAGRCLICGFFDSTAKGARQGGALHKTVARPAENAYFDRGQAPAVSRRGGSSWNYGKIR